MTKSDAGVGDTSGGKSQHVGIVTDHDALLAITKCELFLIAFAQEAHLCGCGNVLAATSKSHHHGVGDVLVCMELHVLESLWI